MPKFRRKPVEVEAVQWLPETMPIDPVDVWPEAVGDGLLRRSGESDLVLKTIHRDFAIARPGDWVIAEPDGSGFYPCNPDVFEATYDPA